MPIGSASGFINPMARELSATVHLLGQARQLCAQLAYEAHELEADIPCVHDLVNAAVRASTSRCDDIARILEGLMGRA